MIWRDDPEAVKFARDLSTILERHGVSEAAWQAIAIGLVEAIKINPVMALDMLAFTASEGIKGAVNRRLRELGGAQ